MGGFALNVRVCPGACRGRYTLAMWPASTGPATFLLQFEEPHQVVDAAVACGTQTGTRTTEEPDQDPGIHPSIACATQTMTFTREEGDQDRDALSSIVCATQTLTKTVEDPDQDPGIGSYFAIPRV